MCKGGGGKEGGYSWMKKSRILETRNLSTDADSSTAAKKLLSIFFCFYAFQRVRVTMAKFLNVADM